MNPSDRFDVIVRVPRTRVNDTGITFPKCMNSGANIGASGEVRSWINGQTTTRRFTPQEQREVMTFVSPLQIQAIEVYTSISRIPAELLDAACAVIADCARDGSCSAHSTT